MLCKGGVSGILCSKTGRAVGPCIGPARLVVCQPGAGDVDSMYDGRAVDLCTRQMAVRQRRCLRQGGGGLGRSTKARGAIFSRHLVGHI